MGGIQSCKYSRLDCPFAQRPVCKYTLAHGSGRPVLYCKANRRGWICCDWLTSIVSMSDYIGTLQFFPPFISLPLPLARSLEGHAACLASQIFRQLTRNPHPQPTRPLYMISHCFQRLCKKQHLPVLLSKLCLLSSQHITHLATQEHAVDESR